MPRPNFFIVGAPKSGTTAMHDYLAGHPAIFMAHKEMNFFCDDLIRDEAVVPHPRRGEAWYEQQFEAAGEADVVGEASVFYLCSRTAAKRIKAFAPDARILIHVRNPVHFIASHHSQLVFEGYEDIADPAEAYDAEAARRDGVGWPARCPFWTILLYREMARFSAQIQRFHEAFGHERVMVTLFDDFQSDTPGTYRRTLEFLGVDPDFRPAFPVVNANKTVRSPLLRNALRQVPDWATELAGQMIGAGTRHRVKEALLSWNTRYTPRPPTDPGLDRRIRGDLESEVNRLSTLLGRDLTGWLQ